MTVSIGPFDVRFHNDGDSYVDPWGTTHTAEKDWTTTEMADVEAIIGTWDYRISNTPARQVKLYLMWDNLGSGVLGSSSNRYRGDGSTATTYTEYVWREGVNQSNSYGDAFLKFGTAFSWHTGSSSPPGGEYDFRSVLCHEIGHSVGVFSTYNSSTDRWWSQGITEWDKQLRDEPTGGDRPAPGSRGTPHNFNQTANPVYWDGAYAKAANGGDRVAIYAPSSYSGGSSLTHLNDADFPNALMKHALASGVAVREPTYLEWQMYKDMGWVLAKFWTKGAGNLQWNQGDNWDFTGAPDLLNDATFTDTGLAPGNTLDLGGDQAVYSLTLDTAVSFTLGGSAGTLTLDSGKVTRSADSAGTQTVARPIDLGANGVWDVGGTGQLAVSGVVSGSSKGIEKRGDGTLLLSGVNTYTGLTAIYAGTLAIGADAPAGSPGALGNTTFNVLLGDTAGSADAALLIAGPFAAARNLTVLPGSSGAAILGGTNTSGTATFAGSIFLLREAALTAAAGGNVEFTGQMSGSHGLTKTGPGTVTLAGSNLFSGNLTAEDGTLNLNSSIDADVAVHVNGTATVRFGVTQHLAALNVGGAGGGDTAAAHLDGGVLVTDSLSIDDDAAFTSSLDVHTRHLVVDYAGASPIATIEAMVASGANTTGGVPQYDGPGIMSTECQAAPNPEFAVGVADNATLTALGIGITNFGGTAVEVDDVLVRYTYQGDATLNGVTDGMDYALIDYAYAGGAGSSPIWMWGDFNYDGVIDGMDYALIDFVYAMHGGGGGLGPLGGDDDPFGGKEPVLITPAPVPEPGTLVVLAVGAVGAVGRSARRRRCALARRGSGHQRG